MTNKEIKEFRIKVSDYIDARQLRAAIKEMKDMAKRRMAWEIGDKIEKAEQNYAYMLRYVAEGINDPERASVYDAIVNELYSALDNLVHFMEKVDNPSQYYSLLRMFEKNGPKNGRLEAVLKGYLDAADKVSLFSLLATGPESKPSLEDQKNAERMQSEAFVAIWTTPAFNSDDREELQKVLGSDLISPSVKVHFLSALTLALFQKYDSRKLELLINAYLQSDDHKVSTAALIGMLFALWLYRNRTLSKKVSAMLETAKESPNWYSDLKTAYIEMIRARDTERINQKIQNEVIPDMMNLRPELLNKINDGEINPIDMASLQENPEWQDLLLKSGIADKLKELTEMQMEGGDVMMSTFSHLKSFAFFNDISNWFLPFSSQNTLVAATAQRLGIMADMLESAMFLCDSDKYSFVFALEMVPPEQRKAMSSQFQQQSDEIYRQMGDMQAGTVPDLRRKAINSYLQNIYRFFKLYRRKEEFFDPFEEGVNLISVPSLSHDFDDAELLEVVAEFYFKLGYMEEAIEVFKKLEAVEQGEAPRYQKIGYAYEKLGEYEKALEMYHRAELLDTNSDWTVKRLAACYRLIGNQDMALKYYRQLAGRNPEDLTTTLLLGYALLEKGDYAEAIKQFYKVEFLDEKSHRSWRPLAWTLFLNGDYEGSQRYYAKIVSDNPTPGDYLNMGHVSLASGDFRDAVNYYKLSVESRKGDRKGFIEALNADAESLRKAGVDAMLVPLIADAVFYAMDN